MVEAGSNVPGDVPADPLTSHAFEVELLKSERLRTVGTLGVLSILIVVVLARDLILRPDGWQIGLAWTFALGILAIGYESMMLAIIGRQQARGTTLPDGAWRLNVAAESLFPTLAIIVVTQLDGFGPHRALVSPSLLLYALVIVLSTLRLQPALSLLAGAVSAGGYLVVTIGTFIAFPRGEVELAPFPPAIYGTNAILLVLAGFAAAAVAAQIRRHVLAAVLEAQERQRLVVHARDTLIFGLAKLAEYRDTDTGAHLDRIAIYSELLARALRDRGEHPEIDDDWIQTMRVAASMHDIGKVGIPDDVLLKPGRLTPEERSVMEEHPTIGSDALRAIEERHGADALLAMSVDIAIGHHERWDGTGYPARVDGPNIPIAARIISVADVYDALTSARVYKPAMPHAKAASIIREGRGTQFDPAVVDAFDAVEGEFDAVREKYQEG